MKVSHLGPRFVELNQGGHVGPDTGTIAFDNQRGEVVLLRYPGGPRGHVIFEAEADAFARLDHPCIAPLLERGVTERGIPFYTQPVAAVHARSLFLSLFPGPHGPSLTLRERVRILIDVSDAVRVVHQAGFLHLQLTPFVLSLTSASHVFVSGGHRHGPPVFIDADSSLDGPNRYYAAPEQLEILSHAGKGRARYCTDAFDARTDVYALGGVLHTLIYDVSEKTDRRIPQYLTTQMRMAPLEYRLPQIRIPKPQYRTTQMRIAKSWPLRQATAQDERLVRELEPIWRWALQPEPANRLPNAGAFARELRQALWSAN